MAFVSISFSILILIISLIVLAGNVRFFDSNRREANIHSNSVRIITPPSINDRFPHSTLPTPNYLYDKSITWHKSNSFDSVVHPLIGITLIVLIASLFKCVLWSLSLILLILFRFQRLNSWGFHVPIYFIVILSVYFIHESNIETENEPISFCIPPTALTFDIYRQRSN
ncbi:hypothetical protein PRIPAC_77834, partial [Pristionchus pacificus]|uniref:Uncharacterized protein n=1 Tax=Pristionchus pacificus TaxID=54126 RepID=A0A2A6C331_PRIPA